MGVFDGGVLGRIRGPIASVTFDFKLAFNRQVGELRGHVANLRRELSAVSLKAQQQDRLVKSLKARDERLVASLKRNI